MTTILRLNSSVSGPDSVTNKLNEQLVAALTETQPEP